MKNPLLKRLPRELIGDIGKYLAVFLFMTATIGFVSGFLVADDSMLAAYQEALRNITSKMETLHWRKRQRTVRSKDWKKKAFRFMKITISKKMRILISTGKRTVQSAFTKTAARSISYA